LYVLGFAGGLALERWAVRVHLAGSAGSRPLLVVLGWLGIVIGLAIAGWGLATFWKARTAVIPNRPARTLVASGPYRFSRNPMYVGLGVLYLGLAMLFDVGWPIVCFPLVVTAVYLFVIRREERYLAAAFGSEYVRYQQRVRRWL
jgi:protein-S-isoprenylcysteine O-methyltransferase Ste14